VRRFIRVFLIGLLSAGCVAPATGFTMPHYSVVDLGFLDEHNKDTLGAAINIQGEVVGTSAVGGSQHPFYWNGHIHDIGVLNGTSGVAVDINDAGIVVGWVNSPQLFVFENGQAVGLGAPQNSYDFLSAGINNVGEVVASPAGDNQCDASNTPFIIGLKGDAPTSLNLLRCAVAVGIDARGEILGHVFLGPAYAWGLVDSHDLDFDRLGRSSSKISSSTPIAINKITDHIAGDIQIGFNHYPVLYIPADDKLLRLPPTSPRLTTGLARAINSHDQIVGTACHSTAQCDGGNHPFLYDPGIGMIDLLSVANIPRGFAEYIAVAINDNGQIVVDASNPPFGPNHTFLLTPN
jgi:probable HAF family extracellular repeat protein